MNIETDFWNQALLDIQRNLNCTACGLTSEEAELRLKTVGPNQAHEHPARSVLIQFLSRFKSPLVLLLLAASGIMAITSDVIDCGIVMLIILLSVTLDFVQERQASKAVDALRRSVAVQTLAIRDGKPQRIAVTALVPGDDPPQSAVGKSAVGKSGAESPRGRSSGGQDDQPAVPAAGRPTRATKQGAKSEGRSSSSPPAPASVARPPGRGSGGGRRSTVHRRAVGGL